MLLLSIKVLLQLKVNNKWLLLMFTDVKNPQSFNQQHKLCIINRSKKLEVL